MDWIETAQKIAPWAGGLPIAHKVVLSALVIGLGSFMLLLIWSPTPARLAQDPASRVVSSLTIIVELSRAAADAAAKFAQELEKSSGITKVEENVEKEQLKKFIKDLSSVREVNAPILLRLRRYVETRGNAENWNQVMNELALSAPIVSELVSVLQSFDGDLIYKDIETYKELRLLISTRAGLYSSLADAGPPSTPEEWQDLIKIANNFQNIVEQMGIVQMLLAQYLNSEAGAR